MRLRKPLPLLWKHLPGSEAGAEAAAAAAESQRRAESSILDTNVGRARFELGRSTDEGDFELDRQTLILSITSPFTLLNNERIDALMLGETEIAQHYEGKPIDLERDIGIRVELTTAENTFTTTTYCQTKWTSSEKPPQMPRKQR